MAARKLIPLIAAGRLRSEATEPFIHGTYLEAWFRCLKCSKEFTHSCRTGMFMSIRIKGGEWFCVAAYSPCCPSLAKTTSTPI